MNVTESNRYRSQRFHPAGLQRYIGRDIRKYSDRSARYGLRVDVNNDPCSACRANQLKTKGETEDNM